MLLKYSLVYSKEFLKHYQKRIFPNKTLVKRFNERLEIFLKNPQDPVLKDHKLTGAKRHLRSFSVTGDIRVVYYLKGDEIRLVDVGTHNQVF